MMQSHKNKIQLIQNKNELCQQSTIFYNLMSDEKTASIYIQDLMNINDILLKCSIELLLDFRIELIDNNQFEIKSCVEELENYQIKKYQNYVEKLLPIARFLEEQNGLEVDKMA